MKYSLKERVELNLHTSGEFNPEDWLGGGQLDYRFYNARTILKDIMMKEDTDA